jgi:hypothetical protein
LYERKREEIKQEIEKRQKDKEVGYIERETKGIKERGGEKERRE